MAFRPYAPTHRWRAPARALRHPTAKIGRALHNPISLSLSQNMTVHPADTEQWKWVRTLLQNLNLHPTDSEICHYHVTDTDTIKLAQAFVRSFPTTLSQNMTVHLAQVAAIGVHVLQQLKLIDAFSPNNHYHLALAQAIMFNSALGRFFNMALTQAMTTHFALSRVYTTSPVLSQALTVHPALTNSLVLSLNGNIKLTPTQLLSAIFQGEALIDGINLQALYIAPNGNATTWAINTRTNAVTEYTNYNFNSFAPFGPLRYVAAATDGLYELDGDTDNGASIISDIMSGFMQLNGTKLSGLKGVYLAMRSEPNGVEMNDQFYLKLITGDNRVYTYQVVAQPGLMNAKVNVGKGLRTNYLAFELISTGADFDLNTIEFVPMLSDRRV